jgi:sulfite dehydrogenase (cytochrome) subunit B
MKKTGAIIAVSILICAAVAAADGLVKNGSERSITLPPPPMPLKQGTGMDVTRRYCSVCHSLDYITTQHKFNKASWQAEVNKMIKVFGAPIDEANAKVIADYIAASYGKAD